MLVEFLILIALVAGLVYLIQLYLTGNHSYWPKRGVHLVKPSEAATFWEFITQKKTIVGMDHEYYKKFKSKGVKYGGIMEFRNPVLYLLDLNIMKEILVKDFDHFVDRRKIKFGNDPVFSKMLSILEGQEWKDVRSVMSPTFTTGKIKRMFEHFNKCGKKLKTYVEGKPKTGTGHNIIVQDVVSRFTVDVIGATAFGMETNALTDPESIFFKMAKRTSDISTIRMLKSFAYVFAPKLANFFGFSIMDTISFDFFIGILTKALRERQASNEKRDDFLQLLIEAKKGELKTDESELEAFEKEAQLKSHKAKTPFTDELAVSQSVLFFLAGFDTVGSLVSFAPYLLAIRQDIQEKLYQEVEKYVNQDTGDIEYESVSKMEYLDMFVSEILRMYPPANRLERRCVKDYVVSDGNLKVPEGQLVAISVQGIHHDEDYYPDPEKFDPERFSTQNKANRHPYAYMPFGMGPRNCIGMRFALIESKVAIAYLVHYFQIQPTAKTPIPLKIENRVGFNRPVRDLELNFTVRGGN